MSNKNNTTFTVKSLMKKIGNRKEIKQHELLNILAFEYKECCLSVAEIKRLVEEKGIKVI